MNPYAQPNSLRKLVLPLVRTQTIFENPAGCRYSLFTYSIGEIGLNSGVSCEYSVNPWMLKTKDSFTTPILYQLIEQKEQARQQAKYWRKQYFKKQQNGG
jgi:hypothetical protein